MSLHSLVESVAKSQSTSLPLESEFLILKLILKEKALFSPEGSCSHKLDNLDKSLEFGKICRTLCRPRPLNKLNCLTLSSFHNSHHKPSWKVGA